MAIWRDFIRSVLEDIAQDWARELLEGPLRGRLVNALETEFPDVARDKLDAIVGRVLRVVAGTVG